MYYGNLLQHFGCLQVGSCNTNIPLQQLRLHYKEVPQIF